jgi:hypothetical protein
VVEAQFGGAFLAEFSQSTVGPIELELELEFEFDLELELLALRQASEREEIEAE